MSTATKQNPIQPSQAILIQEAVGFVLTHYREDLIPEGVDVVRYHTTLGRELRNHYGLWVSEKPLHVAIKAATGLTHPDDMSHWLLEEAQRQARAK